MLDFRPIPPIALARDPLAGFVQEIRLEERRQTIAVARWHVPPGNQGVVQILELAVAEPRRRQGVGSALLRETVTQAARYHREVGVGFRRVWISVEQKSQVIARAFLTQQGFHHVATIGNLVVKQDALIYVKSMD